VTPDEERAILASTAAGIDDSLRSAFAEILALIAAGVVAREAVAQVMEGFTGDMAAAMAQALSAVTGDAVTAAQALRLQVGPIALSSRLYAEAQSVGQVTQGIIDRHLKGYTDARQLALQLFEGYGFREIGAEPLQFNASNDKLPKYLREVLLAEDGLAGSLKRAFARIQVNGLSTDGLRAAYSSLLDAITDIEDGVGAKALEKRLEIAFFERMRYFAQRIAQTEIHRAYANREALIIMGDADIQFVQIRRAPGKQLPCICVLYTGRDQYGMGAGVYPKALAPLPPYHPYCRCIVSPRLDLTGKKAGRIDEEADVYFLRRLQPSVAARVVGSQEKLRRVLAGDSADSVYNAGILPQYKVRTVSQASP
jgi:hypothetical protein